MAKESGQTIIKRALSEQATRNSVPLRVVIEGWETILNYQINVQAPEVEVVLQEKWRKEKEEALKLIEESNTIPMGQPDYWGRIHKAMNNRPPNSRVAPHPIDTLVEEEMRDYRKVHPKESRPGWGYKRSKTRAQIQPNVDEAAEKWRKKRERQTTFLHLLNKK